MISVVVLAMVIVVTVSAQVPRKLNYQGYLPGADGEYVMLFGLYDDPIAGNRVWMEYQLVIIEQGKFSVQLGSVEPLGLPGAKPYYLAMLYRRPYVPNPDSDSPPSLFLPEELDSAPRQEISSAMYALFVDGITVKDNNVGIGTDAPAFQLSLGLSIANTKLALYEAGPDYSYGLGVVPGAFRLHLGGSGARFSFFDGCREDANEIFTIKGNGNVGIGTTNPGEKLHVNGNLKVDGNFMFNGNLKMNGNIVTDGDICIVKCD
jgi:hypothetical protein